MQIEIISVTVNKLPKYSQAEVAYKQDGAIKGKKIVSFSNPTVFETLSGARQGEVFDIKLEKDVKGYWQWIGINKGDASDAPQPAFVKKPSGSTYETPDERAKKQVYIVRQSSISNAIAMGHKKLPEVLQTAKELEQYVFGSNDKTGGMMDMENDIPE